MIRPLVIAHSGFAETIPNSLASISAAGRAGVDGIEVDLQCSADGAPILAHDGVVFSPHGVEHRIAAVSAGAIAKGMLRLPGVDTLPPSLNEVVKACRESGLLLNLDVKDPRVFPAVSQILSRERFHTEVVITGCVIDDLMEIGRPVATASLLVNLTSEHKAADGPGVSNVPGGRRLNELLNHVVALGAQGIDLEHTLVSEELIEAAQRRFLKVAVWTVDRTEDIVRMRSLGVDAITSNTPEAVLKGPPLRIQRRPRARS